MALEKGKLYRVNWRHYDLSYWGGVIMFPITDAYARPTRFGNSDSYDVFIIAAPNANGSVIVVPGTIRTIDVGSDVYVSCEEL